jgi:hypothetical protein
MAVGAYEFFKDFAGPIATVIAAGAAAFVAYTLGRSQAKSASVQARVAKSNWQTANERIVLELFERRIAIFEGIRKVVASVMASGQPSDQTYRDYLSATEKAAYYFGPEVNEYLETIRHLILDIESGNIVMRDDFHPHRIEAVQNHTKRMTELSEFNGRAKILFGPYIQAHQKAEAWRGEQNSR